MLRSRRQQLHGRIAATLKEQFPEIVQTQPEVLARHCAEAGLVEKAVGYWLMAGADEHDHKDGLVVQEINCPPRLTLVKY
jgi:predicted ATPase